MSTKNKIVAAGAAALIGVAGYGVYATTLGVTNAGVSFAAGAATQQQVAGFGTVTITPASPTIDPDGTTYSFANITVAPGQGASWTGVSGKTLNVQGLDSKGAVVTSGTYAITGATTGTVTVPLTAGANANNVTNWSIVVQ